MNDFDNVVLFDKRVSYTPGLHATEDMSFNEYAELGYAHVMRAYCIGGWQCQDWDSHHKERNANN